jgi:hypothetical protein
VTVARCLVCGLAAWPRPAMCRRCGSLRFEDVLVEDGVLEEAAAGWGTVRTSAGPVVVVRVDGAAPGDGVGL